MYCWEPNLTDGGISRIFGIIGILQILNSQISLQVLMIKLETNYESSNFPYKMFFPLKIRKFFEIRMNGKVVYYQIRFSDSN